MGCRWRGSWDISWRAPRSTSLWSRLSEILLRRPSPWQLSEGQLRRVVFVLMLFVLLNGSLWAMLTPKWGAPDENAYFDDTRLTAKHGIVQGITGTSNTRHPPLYPLLAAGPFLLAEPYGEDTQILAIRLLGVVFLALTVWLGFRTARELFPEHAFIPLATAALLALMPQLSFIMASINSDGLLVLMCSVAFWLSARILSQGLTWQRLLSLTLVCAAGVATKERFYLLLPLVFLLLLYEIGRRSIPYLRERHVPVAAVAGTTAVLVMFGASYLVLLSPWKSALWGMLAGPQVDLLRPLAAVFDPNLDNNLPRFLFRQWTGLFGWARYGLSVSLYDAVEKFEVIALVGLSLAGARSGYSRFFRRSVQDRPADVRGHVTAAYALFALTILSFLYATAVYQIYGAGSQGRYLLPIAVPVFLFLSRGLAEILPGAVQGRAWLVLVAALAFLNAAALFAFQVPVYYGGFG